MEECLEKSIVWQEQVIDKKSELRVAEIEAAHKTELENLKTHHVYNLIQQERAQLAAERERYIAAMHSHCPCQCMYLYYPLRQSPC
jgi:hypothetical protein